MSRIRRASQRCFPSAALNLLTFAAWLVLFSATAQAGVLIGVGQDPPPPMGPFEGTDMIMVGDPSNPIPIVPDPTGPPWMKQFVINRDGLGWATEGPLSMVTVMEIITFPPTTAPGLRPIDWHEDIDPTVGDGGMFKWAGGVIEVPFGTGAPPIPGMVSPDGKSIWFNFPPAPPGAPIKITKQLMWNGPGPITPGPAGTNNYVIKVNERPSVPEAATSVLAGLAICGAGVIRRRLRQA